MVDSRSVFTSGLVALLVIGLSAAVGCANDEPAEAATEEVVEPSVPIAQIEIDRNDPSLIAGRFEIVDFHLSPVAVIDDNEALSWLGQLVIYSANTVGIESELCETPEFEERKELFDEYFQVYEVTAQQFRLESPEVDLITVQCAGEPWDGVGSEQFRIAGDTLVAVFDGVFLSLEPY